MNLERGSIPLIVLVALSVPGAVTAQVGAASGSFRPYWHVLLAFAVAWILIAAWAYRIGRKVNRLTAEVDSDSRLP